MPNQNLGQRLEDYRLLTVVFARYAGTGADVQTLTMTSDNDLSEAEFKSQWASRVEEGYLPVGAISYSPGLGNIETFRDSPLSAEDTSELLTMERNRTIAHVIERDRLKKVGSRKETTC